MMYVTYFLEVYGKNYRFTQELELYIPLCYSVWLHYW